MSSVIAEQFTLLAIGLVTIGARVYIRWRSVGPSNWQIDDYLMPLVGVSHFQILYDPLQIIDDCSHTANY